MQSRTQNPAARFARGMQIALAALLPAWALAVWFAPADAHQGIIAKILFVHPPLAFAAYAGFLGCAVAGALYLKYGARRFDHWALAAAEVGVLMATLLLLTGPLWARGTWGKWWTWDLRLTMTLLQYLIYVAYLLLRNFADGEERAARFGAVYALIGVLMIPLNYFAVDIAASRAMHPANLGEGSLGPGMQLPFWLGVAAMLCAAAYLTARRAELEALRDLHARRLQRSGGDASWPT